MNRLGLAAAAARSLDLFAVRSDRARATFGVFALILFTSGLVWAYRQNPSVLHQLRWSYALLLVVVLLPMAAIANATRFHVTARTVGSPCTFGRALVIAAFSTAANLLPLPGGMIVRIANLRGTEDGLAGAVSVTVLSAVLAAVVTLMLSASAFVAYERSTLSVTIFGATTFGFLLVLTLLAFSMIRAALFKLLFIEAGVGVLEAIRIVVCFLMIGSILEPEQALVLNASSIVGSAVSVVPAGLGVKEITAAVIAAQISVSPSVAFVALALNRMIGLSFFMILTLPVSFYRNGAARRVG